MLGKEWNKGNFGGKKNNCHAERFLLRMSTTLEKQGGYLRTATYGARSEQKRLRMSPSVGYALANNQGGGQQHRGFTLIELLVVVLIIGILTEIALSQYQRAVEKSHVTQALTFVRSLANAQEVFFLEKGHYVTSFDELDLEFPGTVNNKGKKTLAHFSCDVRDRQGATWGVPDDLIAVCGHRGYALFARPQNGKIYCYVDSVGKDPNRICKQLSHGIKEGIYYVVQ